MKTLPIPNPSGYEYRTKYGEQEWTEWKQMKQAQAWIMDGLSLSSRDLVVGVCKHADEDNIDGLYPQVAQWRRYPNGSPMEV